MNSYLVNVATQIIIQAIAACGLNIIVGNAGQISLGHAAFVGIGAYSNAMLTTVGKFGVEQVNPMGDAFDPNRHQAISMVENGNVAPNSVIAVMQKGYELNGRVIRPAMVMVARAPSASIDTQA